MKSYIFIRISRQTLIDYLTFVEAQEYFLETLFSVCDRYFKGFLVSENVPKIQIYFFFHSFCGLTKVFSCLFKRATIVKYFRKRFSNKESMATNHLVKRNCRKGIRLNEDA
jgi:hypothetical protein